MIRNATHGDTDRVVQLLADSRLSAGFDDPAGLTGFVFEFSRGDAVRLFLQHITTRRATCIVHDVDGVAQGVLMAAAAPHPFNRSVWIARETVWWIDPAHRGTAAIRMLDAYETWWKAQGCQFGGMAGMGDDPDVRVLYERRGYRPAELHFLKAR